MELVGLLDSPFVRRVAISMALLGIPFKRRALSVFRDFDDFKKISSVVKAPSLVCDDGEVLVDSSVILTFLEAIAPDGNSLIPSDRAEMQRTLQLTGLALTACEKAGQSLYERTLRPTEKQHQPWLTRVDAQLDAALYLLEEAAQRADPWLVGNGLSQADVTVAVTWRFMQHVSPLGIGSAPRPALASFSERAESLSAFSEFPLQETAAAALEPAH